ncbi:energy transducer TonB [bacterium]|nr:energy transducer TonB [bacterium]
MGRFNLLLLAVLISITSIYSQNTSSDGVYDYLQIGHVPVMVDSGKPCYPDSAFKKRVDGVVLVDIIIDEAGKVISAEVSESLPEDIFDAVALDAAFECTFEPMAFDGHPIKVKYRIPFLFGRGQYNLKRCSKVKKD